MLNTIVLIIVSSLSLNAADRWVGTWKLDPARSEFVNFPSAKAMTLVITEEGGFHVLKFTIIGTDGKVQHVGIKQPDKGGKLIAIGNTPVENGVLEVPNDHEWVYKYYSKDGKPEATRYVKLSQDGKEQDADMRGEQDGKKIVEHEVVVRQ